MNYSSFKRKAPPAAPRRDRSDEFASVVIERPTNVRMATPASIAAVRATAPVPQAKLPRKARTVQAIRDAANGQPCEMRLMGVPFCDTATTVWAHWPGLDGDRGMGIKSLDLCGVFACAACHDVLDGRAPPPAGLTRDEVVLAFLFGHMRSLVALARKGIV